MDVRLSNLLNSAERMLRDKNTSSSDTKSGKEKTWTAPELKDSAEFSNLLTGKYQTIQSKLADLQSQLSREQMKQAVLEEKNPNPAELIHVLFGKEPLFPELQAGGSPNFDEMKKSSNLQMAALEKEIREKEVENENVVSLGMIHNSEGFSKAFTDLSSASFKPLNEKSVQKLIQ
jgi:hypothetical protein